MLTVYTFIATHMYSLLIAHIFLDIHSLLLHKFVQCTCMFSVYIENIQVAQQNSNKISFIQMCDSSL